MLTCYHSIILHAILLFSNRNVSLYVRPWRRKAVPSEILVKRLYSPDCKISLASFVLTKPCTLSGKKNYKASWITIFSARFVIHIKPIKPGFQLAQRSTSLFNSFCCTLPVFVACFTEALREILKAQLLDGWKTLSTVQWRKQLVFQLIRCVVFYPVDSTLQRLNNRDRAYCYCILIVNMTRNNSRAWKPGIHLFHVAHNTPKFCMSWKSLRTTVMLGLKWEQ